MKITAAVAEGAGAPFVLKSVELGAPRADEILVRVVGVGVCQHLGDDPLQAQRRGGRQSQQQKAHVSQGAVGHQPTHLQ